MFPGLFVGLLTTNGDCNLIYNKGPLDHEANVRYDVDLRINTLSAYANPRRTAAKVRIDVADVNDNAPQFVYEGEASSELVTDQYLVAIPDATSVGAAVFALKAEDADSGEFGRVSYELVGDDLAEEYFTVDGETGAVSTSASFLGSGVQEDDLPFELIVVARDNPNDIDNSLTQKTMLVVRIKDFV